MEESTASIAAGDDIRPYKIHVSSKYLELTRKKLELTRLPHEILLPRPREWEQGTPKSDIEPLIDFWLEEYSWRTREAHLNATLSQYRTAIPVPGIPVPLRIHFIHIKSSHPHAIPLLVIPSFPLTNLSLVSLIAPLTDPPGASTDPGDGDSQPFHVVIPSIPGLGFSDCLNFPLSSSSSSTSPSVLSSTAYLFNALMLKLSYPQYLASSTGSSAPVVDYHIPRLLGANHGTNCIGIHLIDPPIEEPKISKEPWAWTKFAIARFFHASIFGYVADDWRALTSFNSSRSHKSSLSPRPRAQPTDVEVAAESSSPAEAHQALPSPVAPVRYTHTLSRTTSTLGLGVFAKPNTLSYALCDSPVGLLSLVLAGLKYASPNHSLSNTEIIDIAQMSWLPGPEGAMRFWSSAVGETKQAGKRSETATAVTSFLGERSANEVDGLSASYRPPMWAEARHNVMWTSRPPGRAGLVVWERANVVVEGVRGLAVEVVKACPSLRERVEEFEMSGVVVPMPVAEVEGDEEAAEESELQVEEVESPDTVILAREF